MSRSGLTGRTSTALAAEVADGVRAVCAVLPELDLLAEHCDLPATARGPWTQAAVEADDTAAAWAVLVRGAGRALRAGAVLLAPREGPVVLASGGGGHRAGVAAVDDDAAHALAAALGETTRTRCPGRALELGPLPDDARARALAQALGARVEAGAPVPQVRRDTGTEVRAYLSHGTRKTLRKALNRLAADGLAHAVATTREPREVAALLPVLEEAYRDRDREHGLPCDLDTPAGRRRWRGRAHHLAEAGCLEVTTLTIGEDLAAYVTGLVHEDRYGVVEGRFVTRWARYAPGRLVEAAVLQRVLADEALTALDWMTGVAPEALLAANAAEATVVLHRPPV